MKHRWYIYIYTWLYFEPWFGKLITTLHLYQLFSIYRNHFEPLLYSIIIVWASVTFHNHSEQCFHNDNSIIWKLDIKLLLWNIELSEKLLNEVNSILMLSLYWQGIISRDDFDYVSLLACEFQWPASYHYPNLIQMLFYVVIFKSIPCVVWFYFMCSIPVSENHLNVTTPTGLRKWVTSSFFTPAAPFANMD